MRVTRDNRSPVIEDKEPAFITFCRATATATTAQEFVWNTVSGLEHFPRRQHMKVTAEEAQAVLDHWNEATEGAKAYLTATLDNRPRQVLSILRRLLPWEARAKLNMKKKT